MTSASTGYRLNFHIAQANLFADESPAKTRNCHAWPPGNKTAEQTGTYVDPKDWNALLDDPDVLLVDTRNSYETAIGMFEDAVDPLTQNFRDFPEWAHALANQPPPCRPKKIAMYCTGGIGMKKPALMQTFGV